MNLKKLKRMTITGTLGVIALLGLNVVNYAQNSRWEQQQRIEQQRRYEQQRKAEELQRRRQIELERNNSRYRNNRNNGYSNGYGNNGYNNDSRRVEMLRQAVNRGYQQGYIAGRQDRNARGRYNYNGQSIYRSGNYGYDRSVDESQYRSYFQQGFARGYEDGYYSRNRYGSNGTNILGSILNGIFNLRN